MMNWIYTGMLLISVLASLLTHSGEALSAAVLEGAGAGVTLAITLAGPICLWSGVGKLMDRVGITQMLSACLGPLLHRIFPSTKTNQELSRQLSGNLCANLLGLGNAATPRGIRAARLLKQGNQATDELCRLIVLNTASIQLIPTSVAAIRSSLGCTTPFDILPAVWITSLCSAGMGLAAAWLLGKLWNHA